MGVERDITGNTECIAAAITRAAAVGGRVPAGKGVADSGQAAGVALHRDRVPIVINRSIRRHRPAGIVVAIVSHAVGNGRPLGVKRDVAAAHGKGIAAIVTCAAAVGGRVPAAKVIAGLGQRTGVSPHRYRIGYIIGIAVHGNAAAGVGITVIGDRVIDGRPLGVERDVAAAHGKGIATIVTCPAAVGGRVPAGKRIAGPGQAAGIAQHRSRVTGFITGSVHGNRSAGITVAVVGHLVTAQGNVIKVELVNNAAAGQGNIKAKLGDIDKSGKIQTQKGQ